MIKLTVRGNRVGPIIGRHPWVFSGALKYIPDGLETGAPVELFDEAGRFLAGGYFNSYSQIAVRVWSYEAGEEVDLEFFKKRIRQAHTLRQKYLFSQKTDSFRIVSAENDFLPGLIVDKYAAYLCVQFHTPGMERYKKEIVAALKAELKPKGIYERSDSNHRRVEALEEVTGILYGRVPAETMILENGFKFFVDIKKGQKTGFFLDQRDKRQALAKYCFGERVLNTFSYTGGFSVYALAAGARQVTSVDSSEPAMEMAKRNVELNKLSLKKCEFIVADAKRYLKEMPAAEFKVIVLDPPAFIKDRHKIKEGLRGYRNINEDALAKIEKDGILISCSCSAHLALTDFRFLLSEAAARASRSLQIIETYTHGLDHPELVSFTEGEYLKVFIARAL